MSSLCPFSQWGMDIVGPFPVATGQRKFLLMAVDYFSKWIEAEPLAQITENEVIKFLCKNIICRYGLSRVIISDNGRQFQGGKIQDWCAEQGIQQRFTSVAHPQANGQVEVINRILIQGIKMKLAQVEGQWVDALPGVLWSYRTTSRSNRGETLFNLVYGADVVIPVEAGPETFRIQHYEPENNDCLMRASLDLIEEVRENA
ncbi:UNVERIFIED_CONTAM: Gag-Pol polyprotein [Sesamum latifolium]|uniref:Gag-Pol polyprotein n=1 Tax=Sesamum latifolium TaxID=2727402 RepID=A0AAW2TCB3_9LAMI